MHFSSLFKSITYLLFFTLTSISIGCTSISKSTNTISSPGNSKKVLEIDTIDHHIKYDDLKESLINFKTDRFHDTLMVNDRDLNSRPYRTSTTIVNIVAQPDKTDRNGNSIVYLHFPYMDNPVVKEIQNGYYNTTQVDFNYNYWNTIGFDQDGNSNNLEATFYGYNNSAEFQQFGTNNSITSNQRKNCSVNVSQQGYNNTVKITQQ